MSVPGAPIYTGTSGWAYRHWHGPFYPSDLRPQDRLTYYATHFRSVEVDATFYHLPARRSCAAWAQAVPPDFVFAVKASRYVTHMKKLAVPASAIADLMRRLDPLAGRLGPVLFQLPPHWRCNGARLAAFLAMLSRDYRYAFEFRDTTWWTAEIYDLLARHRVAFCIYDLGGRVSPREVTTDMVYLRLHGPDGPYRGCYDARALGDWAGALARWSAEGRTAYCYFDNDERGDAARNAAELAALLPTPLTSRLIKDQRPANVPAATTSTATTTAITARV
jgi:uncharacterized protein YecE (DUF72 family)